MLGEFVAVYNILGVIGKLLGPFCAGLFLQYFSFNFNTWWNFIFCILSGFWMLMMIPETLD
jgi:MFS-type transporter involved in bile tolerance (Atg22 family)